jgi:phytoene dehydrogenase-like protein
MAAGSSTRAPGGAITGINVTPLVDITLVLLIVFMVTAKLIVRRQALPVDLPKAASGEAGGDAGRPTGTRSEDTACCPGTSRRPRCRRRNSRRMEIGGWTVAHENATVHLTRTSEANAMDYDIIVVGSGMGGLTVASLMSQMRGKRVLVLERHFKSGGYTHSFKRKHFQWDVGVHYVGRLGAGSPVRSLVDFITGGKVDWTPLPTSYDRFFYPTVSFTVRAGREQYQADLSARFPREARNIKAYFDDILAAAQVHTARLFRSHGSLLLNARGLLSTWRAPARFALTTREYLERRFETQELRAIAASIWGNYGLPPHMSPFLLHARIKSAYLDGAHFPDAGAESIAASVEEIVERNGGRFLRGHSVTQIVLHKGRAVGVKAERTNARGEVTGYAEFSAPIVVSDAGAANTFLKLVPAEHPLPLRAELREFLTNHTPTSAVVLYVGLSKDPRTLGFQGENYWIYDSLDHDEVYRRCGDWINKGGLPMMTYVSFSSINQSRPRSHTAQIISVTKSDAFARWRGQPWLSRGDDYTELKQRLSEALLQSAERQCKGFRSMVEYHEMSTPLTNESLTSHASGSIYGLPHVSARLAHRAWTHPKTPVPGLYLTGADVFVMGVVGATMGGILALGNLPDGIRVTEAFAAAQAAERQGRGVPVPLRAGS